MTRILSWNVNGIRAVERKGLVHWLESLEADIVCLQETKANPSQLSEDLLKPGNFATHFASAERKGYSGVAIYTRLRPVEVEYFGVDDFDREGRLIVAHYDDFSLLNAYFPNSQEAGARLDYKLAFCDALKEKTDKWSNQARSVVVCGDFNIAHKEIDLANPQQNQQNPGFLPAERQWMSSFLAAGYSDTFRVFEPGGGHYTWWSYRAGARRRNIGWRIDYHCVNETMKDRVLHAGILSNVAGSDHCPVELVFE